MSSEQPYRVMVVDDSAVIRGLLTRSLEADPAISVVASAQNGAHAVQALERNSKDIEVVVLDIEMPVMDGLTALPLLIKALPGIQVIMASTLTRKNAEISLRALQAGAADYVTKPSSSGAINSADDFKRELTEKVKVLGQAARRSRPARSQAASAARAAAARSVKPAPYRNVKIELRRAPIHPPTALAIGSSTGGPQALLHLLTDLGQGIRLPIFVTQHMPATFTTLLAEHIARGTAFGCSEGSDGARVAEGHIHLAPGGYHMVVEAGVPKPIVRLNQNAPENFCRPAVDPMLRSLAKVYGAGLLVVILTGMGSDGMRGCQAVVAAGGSVIAQDEATSVVWGMPGAVAAAGLCTAILPLSEIAPYIRKLLVRSAA
ncbi:MAG: chemotaxis response regulator protein-glutamate methylesterase [Kiloniellales bacterium]